jgi:hypothetical protein
MLASWYDEQGPAADALQVGELPDPQPGPGEVRVKVTVTLVLLALAATPARASATAALRRSPQHSTAP